MSRGRPGTKKVEVLANQVKKLLKSSKPLIFDANRARKINPKELKPAMKSLGFDKKNPTIFHLIADLDTPDVDKNRRISVIDFINSINDKLEAEESKELEESMIYSLINQMKTQSLKAHYKIRGNYF